MYQDMKDTFGFEPTYSTTAATESRYFYASLDAQKPLVISDYDISVNIFSDRFMNNKNPASFKFHLKGADYVLSVERLSNQEARVSVKNAAGIELIGTGLYEFTKGLMEKGNAPKEAIPPEKMTLEVAQNGYKLKIFFQHISVTHGTDTDSGVDYSAIVLFAAPAK